MGIIFLLLNVVFIQSNALDAVRTNVLDKYCIGEINECISSYEQINNVAVKAVGFCYDANPTYKYHGYIKNEGGDLSIKAFAQIWSQYPSFVYYTGRNLLLVEVPKEIAGRFAGQDWTRLDVEQQIVFDGENVYICILNYENLTGKDRL